jgi:hypothetical protein
MTNGRVHRHGDRDQPDRTGPRWVRHDHGNPGFSAGTSGYRGTALGWAHHRTRLTKTGQPDRRKR